MISSRQLRTIQNWNIAWVVRIVVVRVQGSAPRETGASMWVGEQEFEGTIGGGRLEFEALARARALLSKSAELPNWTIEGHNWPLGPELGQCCGGVVDIMFQLVSVSELEYFFAQTQQADPRSLIVHKVHEQGPPLLIHERHELRDLPLHALAAVTKLLRGEWPREPKLVGDIRDEAWFVEPLRVPDKPLFIYGAGHVGRAIVNGLEDLEFAITWVDTQEQRFPAGGSSKSTKVVAKYPQDIAQKAPGDAYHLILTFSHEVDFELCRTLLTNNRFGYLGLIGSKTKRARFLKRLGEQGVAPETLSRLTCPIGIEHIKGKQPARIAVSVVAQLLQRLEAEQCSLVPAERRTHGFAK